MINVSGIEVKCELIGIDHLNYVNKEDIFMIPHSSGVYFLLSSYCSNGNNISYIGETKDLKNRVSGHPIFRNEDISGVCWLALPDYAEAERKALEKLYIMHYTPPLNRESNGRFL